MEGRHHGGACLTCGGSCHIPLDIMLTATVCALERCVLQDILYELPENPAMRRMHTMNADKIIEDVEGYLFVKPGSLAQFVTNALVQCAPHPPTRR